MPTRHNDYAALGRPVMHPRRVKRRVPIVFLFVGYILAIAWHVLGEACQVLSSLSTTWQLLGILVTSAPVGQQLNVPLL